jgi:hypothetical protein
MKFHWLIFKYDISKLQDMRPDYKGHDNTTAFTYACASVKTFLTHNDRFDDCVIWTDDISLVRDVFSKYNVKCPSDIREIRADIERYKKHLYPWNVKSEFMVDYFSKEGRASLFVDNDCICKKSVDGLSTQLTDQTVILWEKERQIKNSRDYWGWKLSADHLHKSHEYWVANDGIIGLTKNNLNINNLARKYCLDLYENVDISKFYPDRHPKLMISQQMAICFAAQDNGLEILESKEYFDHFYSDKSKCIAFL